MPKTAEQYNCNCGTMLFGFLFHRFLMSTWIQFWIIYEFSIKKVCENIKFYFRPSREIISNKESKFRRIEVMKVILLISYIFFFFFFVFFSQNKFYFEKFQHTLFFFKIFRWRIFVKKHEISFLTIMLLFLFLKI